LVELGCQLALAVSQEGEGGLDSLPKADGIGDSMNGAKSGYKLLSMANFQYLSLLWHRVEKLGHQWELAELLVNVDPVREARFGGSESVDLGCKVELQRNADSP
jgi:hypothetical protein